MSPTMRTYAWLRGLGFWCEPATCTRKYGGKWDLFGCLDAVVPLGPDEALPLSRTVEIPGPCLVGVQITDDTHHAARADKIRASEGAMRFLASKGRIVVFSWGLRGARGKRKTLTLRVEEVRP